MRVTCPNCEAKFKVPDKALGATGRKLRCGSCEHQWFQKPRPPKAKKPTAKTAPKPEVEQQEPADDSKLNPPENTPTDGPRLDDTGDDNDPIDHDTDSEDMEPPPIGDVSRFRGFRPREDRKRKPVALFVLIGMAVLIPTILLAARGSLVQAWPPSALLYDTIGLRVAVPGEGLVLRNVSVRRRQEGAVEILVVEGQIRNPTEGLISVPALRGTVLDDTGTALQEWLFQAEALQLLPNESAPFASEFAGPAPGAAQVNVTFSAERPDAGLGY